MTHNQAEVSASWIGQDGNEYRTKSVWIGVGYKSYMQKKLANGAWWNV